ncbi:hypothetical protein ACR6C2_00170 [Streptomyces sp. INA 01156]
MSYDQYSAELFVGDHARAGHGKGMRAVLHASFAVSLAEYCLSKEYRHPGFVVLDSPWSPTVSPAYAARTTRSCLTVSSTTSTATCSSDSQVRPSSWRMGIRLRTSWSRHTCTCSAATRATTALGSSPSCLTQ